jgi:glycosyltransferase involved in cell wall biosynthesis
MHVFIVRHIDSNRAACGAQQALRGFPLYAYRFARTTSRALIHMKVFCITEDLDRPTRALFVGLRQAGVELTVVCPTNASEAREEMRAAGIEICDLTFTKRIDRAASAELRRILIDGEFDILHAFGNKGLQNGLLATRGLPVKIVTYRGIVGNLSFFSPVSWMRHLNPRIDRIICVADAVRDFLLSMRPAFLRLAPEKVVRIYKGHDLAWYDAQPADLTTVGVPADAFVVATVANYRPRKGIEVLVEAIAALPKDWQVHLLLVGNMQSERLDAAIERSGCADRIHRLGHRSDAPSLSAACDVFVLPSIKREGLARSLIEAMAYRRPCIATDCGGSPELVIDGESGLIVPPGDAAALTDAMCKLYQDASLRQRLGAAARERIGRHFRIEDTIASTLAVYRSLSG